MYIIVVNTLDCGVLVTNIKFPGLPLSIMGKLGILQTSFPFCEDTENTKREKCACPR